MPQKPLFLPEEYRDNTREELELLQTAYQKAIIALKKNITPKGFSACSLHDNTVHGTDVNYRSVWARDGAKTIVWSLETDDPEIRQCQADTLRTLFSHQSPAGQIPSNVPLDDIYPPDYGGVGGITSIDSGLWVVIAMYRYALITNDWSVCDDFRYQLQRLMDWLSAHDSNNCGLLEIPEAGDWTDLFARSYHVLYDEVLWFRCLQCYALILQHYGEDQKANDYNKWADHVNKVILRKFWPSTKWDLEQVNPNFTEVQFAMGDSRYLVSDITPFGFNWRCDVYGNLLAYLMNLTNKDHAMMTFRFLWGVGVSDPGPVRNIYPVIYAGDPQWKSYFTVNLLNLPHHYHNGGIWPFIGGLWVRFIHKLGMKKLAMREMVKLAELCAKGVNHDWEFNEWHHGVTGRPMGKAFQAWSCASFLQACHDLHIDAASIQHRE